MTKGRKKTPVRLKILLGDPGKRGTDGIDIEPEGGFPICPREIKGEARREWRRLRKVLKPLQLVTPADRAAVMGYCIAFARMVEAHKKVDEKGLIVTTKGGNIIQNPYLSAANKAMELMRKFISELGLSPTSRGGLRLPVKLPKDGFDAFMQGKGKGRRGA